ncbi:MAG: hypothetical protein J7K75_08475 [Desulfuromonas sp.]|nr:hypothetical protein [Desulfuromonas sp.]
MPYDIAPSSLSHHGSGSRPTVRAGELYTSFDTAGLAEKLGALPEQVRNAATWAARHTRDWLRTQVLRDLNAELGTTKKRLAMRFRKGGNGRNTMSKDTTMATLWIGVNPMGVEALKLKLRQTKSGVRVGKRYYPGAFVADVYGTGKPGVWKRLGRKRLPLIKMMVPVQPEAAHIVPKYVGEAAAIFEQRFEHDLRYLVDWGKK